MTQARLPVSVSASFALHVGGLLLFLRASQLASQAPIKTISDVDLLIQVRKLAPAQTRAQTPPPTMKDFLKMALPAVHKIEPRTMEIKLPEIKRPLMPAAPKLEDRGRMQQMAKLEALDLSQRRVDAARIDARTESRHATALAALPRLEDVGMRRIKNLPQAIALEERRQQAVALQTIQQLAPVSARHATGPAEVLREAAPSDSKGLSKAIRDFLPAASEPVALQPRAVEPRPMIKRIEQAPPAAPRRTAAVQAPKQGVEIEGPLKDRKVVTYDIPEFPEWAKQQGVVEAAVSVRFYVDPEGNVVPDMRVEHTSGYGRLDRLAMDSLRNWKFAPIGLAERQWGIITFRFVLE